MGLFGKKKKGTPPPCCGRTPETAVRVGADKTAASVKVLGSGCARCSALEAAVRAALAELGVDAAIEHVTDFMQIAAYGVMTTPALVVGGRVVSCGCGRCSGRPWKKKRWNRALRCDILAPVSQWERGWDEWTYHRTKCSDWPPTRWIT